MTDEPEKPASPRTPDDPLNPSDSLGCVATNCCAATLTDDERQERAEGVAS